MVSAAERCQAPRARKRISLAALLLVTILAVPCALLVRTGPARPQVPAVQPFQAADRVLVLAPHEDDEALGAGGAIQAALAAEATVRVVLTYGDANRRATIAYRQDSELTPEIMRAMGRLRREEAVKATARLGLDAGQVAFLGYPDGYCLEIWKSHWGKSPALRSPVTDAENVPYEEALACGQPHKGEALLANLTAQLLEFRPTRILVSHPVDGHGDHQAAALFLLTALLDTAGSLPAPEVLAYPTHAKGFPEPKKERPDYWLPVPRALSTYPYPWRCLELTPAQVRLKTQVLGLYRTQMLLDRREMLSFARRNELFAEIAVVPLSRAATPGPGTAGRIEYRDAGDVLTVAIPLQTLEKRGHGVTVCAFGYRHDRPFGQMPKVRTVWLSGGLSSFDQQTALPADVVRFVRTNDELTLFFPWAALGEPDIVFVQAGEESDDSSQHPSAGWVVLGRGS
jgi:LmbE family N-acetylglucosaminyl deacetylase